MVDEGCSLPTLPLFFSFNFCMCFLFVLLITVKKYRNQNQYVWFLSLTPPPSSGWYLFSQPAEAEKGWNEDSEGHQDGKHEAAVV